MKVHNVRGEVINPVHVTMFAILTKNNMKIKGKKARRESKFPTP